MIPNAKIVNSKTKPNIKKVIPTDEPKLAKEPACHPISTTGNLIPVLLTICLTILVTIGVNSAITQLNPVKPTPA